MLHGIKCSYWEKPKDTPEEFFIDKAANLGFDAMELETRMVMEKEDDQLVRLGDYARDKGITLTLGSGPARKYDLCAVDAAARKAAIAFRISLIEKACKAGIKLIGGGLHTYWPVDFREKVDKTGDWGRSVEGMQVVAKAAESHGVSLCVEVMNRYENHILNTAAEGVAFCKDVGSGSVKLLLDTFHMNIEEDSIPAAIRSAGPLLGHLHTGENNRKVPGKGHLPWREIFEALADIGYDGTEIMEPFVRSDGATAPVIHVWRMMVDGGEEKMDRDATDALQFLRCIGRNVQDSRLEPTWRKADDPEPGADR